MTHSPQKKINLSPDEYNLIRNFIYKETGINFGEKRRDLLKSRLDSVISSLGLNSYKDYYEHLKSNPSKNAMNELIDAVTTSHTYFFRHKKQFEYLRKNAIRQLVEANLKEKDSSIKIWCAACATGEEPYSIAISLHEELSEKYLENISILATDISEKSILNAKAGVYSKNQTENVSSDLLDKYFFKDPTQNSESYVVIEKLKNMISFQPFNIITEHFSKSQTFDIIFCRNVMIFFDQENQKALELRIINLLRKNGFLFYGDSESLSIANTNFMNHLGQSIYQNF